MRRSRVIDQKGRWIKENSKNGERHYYHCAERKERKVGEAWEKWFKLT